MVVDVEKIMEDIREEIAGKKLTCDIPAAQEIVTLPALESNERQELQNEVGFLYQKSAVSAWRELHSHRPVLGGIILFVKKVIRKLTKFYVEPITQDQSEWNLHCAHALSSACQLLEEKELELARLRGQARRQEERLSELETRLAALSGTRKEQPL